VKTSSKRFTFIKISQKRKKKEESQHHQSIDYFPFQ